MDERRREKAHPKGGLAYHPDCMFELPTLAYTMSMHTDIAKLFVCATLSGLDKTAISAAAIYGLKTDLHLSGQDYSWVGSAPFFGGLAFMGPAAYCLQNVPAVTFFSFNVFMWGVCSMCMAACTSFGEIFVCRFLYEKSIFLKRPPADIMS